ncbi:ATP-binding protein [Yangia mangrovi]|uniref:ATP-binding protein n=2 Tax=Alloyangia mangrovi TaxID=1779329 RepID=A0A2A3JV91_9RHOB|nr:ATP-binding protein [Alloyangia pacifica]MCA0946336.1 ATP-binding protein [Alloyangia pacifica]MCT4368832.1 ATP-binding protein [Alloyangia mangrovi]
MPLATSRDVVAARQAVARFMKDRGASALRITRFATAVSEISRNAIVHGGGGDISIYLDGRNEYLHVECRDTGPGIEDVTLAMTEGYTSGGGLGRGLGGAKRLSHGFEIHSVPGEGTLVSMSVKL